MSSGKQQPAAALDHRLLAEEMEIYFINEDIGAGLPVWLPKGMAIRDSLEAFIKKREQLGGYQRVASPHIGKAELYHQSGHLRAFQGNMFPPMKWPEEQSEYYLRPMNCPHHHKVFSSSHRSYKQLPLRIAEYGQVYRFENSGSLRGLSRVRGLCQNDAHIYVDPSEAAEEIDRVLALHEECYKALKLEGYRYRLSKQDSKRRQDFDGPEELWLQAESILREALVKRSLPFFEADGEAAFYGPKIDVQMKIGSSVEESVASVQLDFNSGEKFDLKYIDAQGKTVHPWVIHRAPLGSHERFVSLLLEYFEGQLPGWLAPVQLYVLPVGDEALEVARKMAQELLRSDLRVEVDENSGSLSKRILFAHRLRPFAKLVLGPKELESGEVKIEHRGQAQVLSLASIQDWLSKEVRMPQ